MGREILSNTSKFHGTAQTIKSQQSWRENARRANLKFASACLYCCPPSFCIHAGFQFSEGVKFHCHVVWPWIVEIASLASTPFNRSLWKVGPQSCDCGKLTRNLLIVYVLWFDYVHLCKQQPENLSDLPLIRHELLLFDIKLFTFIVFVWLGGYATRYLFVSFWRKFKGQHD